MVVGLLLLLLLLLLHVPDILVSVPLSLSNAGTDALQGVEGGVS
jgi:hypothetical protein